jgi:hypothetical protein
MLQIANSIIYSINPAFIMVEVVIIRVSYFKNVVLVAQVAYPFFFDI